MTYTEPQLIRLHQLATAYGHWYAPHLRPDEDVGTTHDELMARLHERETAASDPDVTPLPRQVYGPPAPDTHHMTGTGRLTWQVDADGYTLLRVWRPSRQQRAWRRARSILVQHDAWEIAELIGEEPCGEGELVLSSAVPYLDGEDFYVRRHNEYAVRHVDALREALHSIGRDVERKALRSLLYGCGDLFEVAAQIRAKDDLDLVLLERCMPRSA